MGWGNFGGGGGFRGAAALPICFQAVSGCEYTQSLTSLSLLSPWLSFFNSDPTPTGHGGRRGFSIFLIECVAVSSLSPRQEAGRRRAIPRALLAAASTAQNSPPLPRRATRRRASSQGATRCARSRQLFRKSAQRGVRCVKADIARIARNRRLKPRRARRRACGGVGCGPSSSRAGKGWAGFAPMADKPSRISL